MDGNHDQRVWEVYDLQRSCRLNIKYWTEKLSPRHTLNFWIEYAIAITAPGSAIAALVFWKTQGGQIIWLLLTVLTALLGIAKPLLKLSRDIEALQKVITGCRALDFQAAELVGDIRREESYSKEMIQTFKRLQRQMQEVSRDEPVWKLDEALRQRCFEAVNRELPVDSFYIPPAPPN